MRLRSQATFSFLLAIISLTSLKYLTVMQTLFVFCDYFNQVLAFLLVNECQI